MVRSWRVRLLLCCLLLVLVLYTLNGLDLFSPSGSIADQCQGRQCKALPSLHSYGQHHSKLEAPVFNQRNYLAAPDILTPSETATKRQRPSTRLRWAPSTQPPSPKPVERAKPAVQDVQDSLKNASVHRALVSQSYHAAPPLPARFRNLSMEDVDSVKLFVFFIGYGRSGHSIVGSIMDAHPNVIIAHEYYLFDRLQYVLHRRPALQSSGKKKLFDRLYYSSYFSATRGWRSNRKTGKGYNFNMNGTWQGQFDRLEVIGDKTGGSTAMLYHDNPWLFKSLLKMLKGVTNLPYSAIHVVRNPYDMIATVAMFQASTDVNNVKITASVEEKFKETEFVQMAADIVLTKAKAVAAMIADCQLRVLEIHLEELIADPSAVIHHICEFLNVPCMQEYVDASIEKVYRKASYSRDLVVWPASVRRRVNAAIKRFSFFNQYSFEGR